MYIHIYVVCIYNNIILSNMLYIKNIIYNECNNGVLAFVKMCRNEGSRA